MPVLAETEEGTESVTYVLRDLALDFPEDPVELLGRRADGVRIGIPLERITQIGGRRKKDVVREMQAEAAANAPSDEEEE